MGRVRDRQSWRRGEGKECSTDEVGIVDMTALPPTTTNPLEVAASIPSGPRSLHAHERFLSVAVPQLSSPALETVCAWTMLSNCVIEVIACQENYATRIFVIMRTTILAWVAGGPASRSGPWLHLCGVARQSSHTWYAPASGICQF